MRHAALFLAPFCLLASACGGAGETTSVEMTEVSQEAVLDRYEGDWTGVLDTGGPQLTLTLEVRGEDAVLISVDQGGARLPIEVTQRDEAGFAGTIAAVGAALGLDLTTPDTLAGTFSQGGGTLPLTLTRGTREGSAELPPNDDFLVLSGDVQLAGTLQLPDTEGPAPAILMLNGSGPQDRDATVMGQPVFAVLADALAARGIATLRLDDRGVGGSDTVAPASPFDLASDATAALAALREAGGVLASCTGILGHSEGGLIAFLAAEEANPSFLIPLAGMHMTMAETLYDQSEALFMASGAGQAAVDQNRALQTAMFEVMRDESVEDYAAALIEALTARGFPRQAAEQQAAIWGQPYSIASLDLDSRQQMAAYDGPVHAFFGGLDLQVLAGPQSERLLEARGGQPTEITVLDGLNHLFQEAETGLIQEYATAPHAMAPQALDAIADAAEALIAQACE
ncbi:serine aminopeptidase domain-containing protein [Hyphobacterium sp.]|uniref:serine aminopeptidase domain-containing protein n=1 Tax=Hyphobacterium sp. TaxID=2004662 RepID=UPI003BA93A51